MQNLAYEIILTLGQAFEVAYQLALQARKGGHSSTLPESFENKPSKPIPKPRVSIRKSVVSRQDTGVLRTEGKDLWCVGAAKNPEPALPVLPSALSWLVTVILSAQFLQSWGPSTEPWRLPRKPHLPCALQHPGRGLGAAVPGQSLL